MNTLSIIKELKATSSRLEKEAILKREKDNQLLQDFFFEALDEMHNFYLTWDARQVNHSGTHTLSQVVFGLDNLLYKLRTRLVTGNAAMAMVEETMQDLTADDAVVLGLILNRDPDCGVQASTVNKIWPELIHEYDVLLAQKDEPKNRANIKFPAFAEYKCDGMRINVDVRHTKQGGTTVEYRSRSGKALEINTPDLDVSFIKMSNSNDVIYDGEMLAVDRSGKTMDRQTGNGLGNKAVRGTISESEKQLIGVVLWDRIPLKEWLAKKGTTPYTQRIEDLSADFNSLKGEQPRIQLVERREVASWDEASAFYADVVEHGGEGLLMKNMNHLWMPTRSKDLVKMKEIKTGEFEVFKWQAGEGRLVGKMGSLWVRDKSGDVITSIGGGYSDKQRAEFTPDAMIGKIIEVKYNSVIPNKDDPTKWSLFLPRFKTVRTDKKEADDVRPT